MSPLCFEPYAPVRRQLLTLLRKVNSVRRQAGFQVLPIEVLPMRRRLVKPFGEEGVMKEGAFVARHGVSFDIHTTVS